MASAQDAARAEIVDRRTRLALSTVSRRGSTAGIPVCKGSRMEACLGSALERDEFRLEYQPIYSLSTGLVTKVEALLRWHSRAFGSVPPSRFVPVMEESELVHDIGSWVLDRVCAQAVEWRRLGLAAKLCVRTYGTSRRSSRRSMQRSRTRRPSSRRRHTSTWRSFSSSPRRTADSMCALSTASSPRSTGFSRRSAKRPPDRPTPGIAVSRRIRDHSRRDARRRRSRGTSLWIAGRPEG